MNVSGMNGSGSRIDQWLQTQLTCSRVTFLCGGYLLLQTLIFLYAVTVPGMEDRLGFVRGRDLLQFFISGRMVANGESHHLYDHRFFTQTQYELHPLTDANREKNPPYFSFVSTAVGTFNVAAGEASLRPVCGLGLALDCGRIRLCGTLDYSRS